MKIVPALLADNFEEFLFRFRQAEAFADYVQVDLMDGAFVPSMSFPGKKINDIQTVIPFEVHLMVKHPAAYMTRIDNSKLKKVIFHFESEVKHIEFINQLRKRGIKAGLAIKPETEIDSFKEIAEHVDTLMFLTVDPCCYGNPFKHEVMGKIEKARKIFRDKLISADGGVSLENLHSFFSLGVDYVCVGSRIFLEDDPEEKYNLFIKKLAEFEIKRPA
ncbi:MAG: hypothetical protein V1854_07425 [Methanobacteriota archaeon]